MAQQPRSTSSIASPVEACVREHVNEVELVIADLSEAVEFLTDKICAVELANEARSRMEARFSAMRASLEQRCAAARASGSQSRSADEEDPCVMADAYRSMSDNATEWSLSGGRQANPTATALAARLLLERRLARRQ
jgi:hypothetical protein